MKVTFTRTNPSSYSVSVEGDGIDHAIMDPAPGFHDRLPHDAAHFIVENELGITGGIFGQLAAGGTAKTFHSKTAKYPRRRRKRGTAMAKASKEDMDRSEQMVCVVQAYWERREAILDTGLAASDIDRICEKFDAFAQEWQLLEPGGSVTLEWHCQRRRKL